MYIKKRFESKNEAAPPEVDSVLKKNAPALLSILNGKFKAAGSKARLALPDPNQAWFSDGWYLRVKSAGAWDDASRRLNLRLDGTEHDGVIYKDGEIYLKQGSRPMSHRGQVSASQIGEAVDIIAEKLVGTTDEPYEIDKIKAYMDKNGWRWFFNEHSHYFEFTKAGKELSGSLVPWCAYVLTKDGKYYVGRSLKDWKKDLKALGIMESVGEAKVSFTGSAHAGLKAANAVRDFLASYLKNELENKGDLDYAVRKYDDVYPYVEVVAKDSPDSGSYLTVWVYSPLGDGNHKIAYKYFQHPNNRVDCPDNVHGLEGIAKMLVQIVDGKPAHSEGADSLDDYLAEFKDAFETQWGPWGWEKAYALVLGNEEWMQEIKDNWANHDYDPAEMAEFAIKNWFGDDESKSEGASTYTFTWWDNAPAADRRPTTRADLKNSKHKETFTAKDDADALEQAVQFLLDADGDDRDDYASAEEVWDHFDSDWGSGSPIPMVLRQGRRIIKDSGFGPAGDESKSESAEEKLDYEKGHKNSKGEDAPWVIRSHADGRVLASFAKKDDAEKHLQRMKGYADRKEAKMSSIEEICDALNRFAVARTLPYKADILDGAKRKHISLHNERSYLDICYNDKGELEVWEPDAPMPSHVIAEWNSIPEIAGYLLGIMYRYLHRSSVRK